MATNHFRNGPLGLEGGVIDLFGVRGFALDGQWHVNIMGGEYTTVGTGKPSGQIAEALDNGVRSEIVGVVICPLYAVLLFLEGKITPQDAKQATVSEDGEEIRFRVQVDRGQSRNFWDVVVRQDAGHTIRTIDGKARP